MHDATRTTRTLSPEPFIVETVSAVATLITPLLQRASAARTILTLIVFDVLALIVVYGLAVVVRYTLGSEIPLDAYVSAAPLIALFIAGLALNGLYPGVLMHPVDRLKRTVVATAVSGMLILSTLFALKLGANYSRLVFVATWILAGPALLLARYVAHRLCGDQPWWGQSAMVFGASAQSRNLVTSLTRQETGMAVVGLLSEGRLQASQAYSEVTRRVEAANCADLASHVIVPVTGLSSEDLQRVIQETCAGFRHVLLVPDVNGICSMGMNVRQVGAHVGFEMPQRLFTPAGRWSKRLVDIVFSACGLLLAAPFFALMYVVIRTTSDGPAVFGHQRFGKDGRPFKAWKFRTMVADADAALARYLEETPAAKAEWERNQKLPNDPRITSIGRLLRRASIDELPQLWNVLVGEMSIVGPRPVVKMEMEVSKYGRSYLTYTRVRPGLTGLWQVSGRNNTTFEERVSLDEYYVRNWSIWLDAHILIRTVRAVVTAEGAY